MHSTSFMYFLVKYKTRLFRVHCRIFLYIERSVLQILWCNINKLQQLRTQNSPTMVLVFVLVISNIYICICLSVEWTEPSKARSPCISWPRPVYRLWYTCRSSCVCRVSYVLSTCPCMSSQTPLGFMKQVNAAETPRQTSVTNTIAIWDPLVN